MSTPKASFHDLPPEAYPIALYAFRRSDGKQVWSAHITEPAALFVPPLAKEHGPVRIRVEFGDGRIIDDGEEIQP